MAPVRTTSELRFALRQPLARARERIGAGGEVEATVILLTRHGYATTRATIESLRRTAGRSHRVIAVDIASPPAARRYQAQRDRDDPDFIHLPIDELVSRQSARLLALDLVDSEHVAFLDNDMLLSDGWLDVLLQASEETSAALVSPLVVTQGGAIHFSGGEVRRRFGRVTRHHGQRGAPPPAQYRDCTLKRVDIEFAESHLCLARTAAVRIPGVMKECMHNWHTLTYAGYKLRHHHGQRVVLEPRAVASMVPIAFGYDLPWLCRSYMRPELIEGTYGELTRLMGRGPSNDLAPARWWHGMHLRFLLGTMLEGERLQRDDLLAPDEIPRAMRGFDEPLPESLGDDIERVLMPHVRRRCPELEALIRPWL